MPAMTIQSLLGIGPAPCRALLSRMVRDGVLEKTADKKFRAAMSLPQYHARIMQSLIDDFFEGDALDALRAAALCHPDPDLPDLLEEALYT